MATLQSVIVYESDGLRSICSPVNGDACTIALAALRKKCLGAGIPQLAQKPSSSAWASSASRRLPCLLTIPLKASNRSPCTQGNALV